MNVRNTAYEVIYDVFENEAFLPIALSRALKKKPYEKRERAQIASLSYGVVARASNLDQIISRLTKKPLHVLDKRTLNVLRLALFELAYVDNSKPYAVLNESVSLAKKLTKNRSTRFVNAVLRNATRDKNLVPKAVDKTDFTDYLSTMYAMPESISSMLITRFGREHAEAFCKSSLEKPALTLYVNKSKITEGELIKRLNEEGFNAVPSRMDDALIHLNSASGLFDTSLFEQGLFHVIDAGAVAAVLALSPQQNEFIVDLCAAPGGKTSVIAQKMNGTGKILAVDRYPHKMTLLKRNLQQLSIDNVTCKLADATLAASWGIQADRVLLDAPCSGLGVIRRKPDVKWRYRQDEQLLLLQKKLLDAAGALVKPGGTLVYATCTLTESENERQVLRFLQDHPSFALTRIELNGGMRFDYESRSFFYMLPHTDDTDGFFISKMIRKDG